MLHFVNKPVLYIQVHPHAAEASANVFQQNIGEFEWQNQDLMFYIFYQSEQLKPPHQLLGALGT